MIDEKRSNSTWVDNRSNKPLILPLKNNWLVCWKDSSWKFTTLFGAEQFRDFLLSSQKGNM